MTVKNGGGVSADPVVKAVLGAIGKRYLVEHWENEDGTQEYDLYSDGFIVQSGTVGLTPGKTLINLPKGFRTKKYEVFLQLSRPNFTGQWYPDAGTGVVADVQAESFSITIYNSDLSSEFEIYWIAQGYAA